MSGDRGSIVARVGAIQEITPLVKRFRFETVDGSRLPSFSAGAHVIVEMEDGDLLRHNAYSLMSSPDDRSHYAISVRRNEGGRGGSRFLHDSVHEGKTVRISRPVNLFPIDQRAKRHLLVAGGIGITPFMAMMSHLALHDRVFELHYANRSRTYAAYADDLAGLYGERIHLYHEDQGEKIPLTHLLRLQPLGTHLYVCGPQGMIDWVVGLAADLGWPKEAIHSERFLAPLTGDPFEIELSASGTTVAVKRQQSMLEAIEAAGIAVPFLCRGGACGQCETRVVECDGDLIHADHFLSEEEKASGEKIMPCVSRFKGRRLVLDR